MIARTKKKKHANVECLSIWFLLLGVFLYSFFSNHAVATFRKGVRAVQMVGRASMYQLNQFNKNKKPNVQNKIERLFGFS